MPFIEQLGQQAIGSVLGIGLAGWNDARQVHQQGELNQLEREQMDYAMKKQYEMWEKTGYVGQMAQMKKAGINPALMYGMGGGGGQSTGSPGSAHTAAAGHSGEAMGIGLAAANMGLLKAQKENIEADTRNKKAGTGKTTEETKVIPLQGEKIKAETANTRMDIGLKEIETSYQNRSLEDRLGQIQALYKKTTEEAESAQVKKEIDVATQDQQIKQAALQTYEAILKNALLEVQKEATQKGIQVDNAQIAKWTQELLNATRGLNQKDQEIAIQNATQKMNQERPGLGQIAAGAIQRAANWTDKFIPGLFGILGGKGIISNK